MEVMRAHFRPEFLNRLDEIILFHRLDQEHMGPIVELQVARVGIQGSKVASGDSSGTAAATLDEPAYVVTPERFADGSFVAWLESEIKSVGLANSTSA